MLDPAWPPGASSSRTTVDSPSDAPYTAAASPRGPAPDNDQVEQVAVEPLQDAEAVCQFAVGRPLQQQLVPAGDDRRVGVGDVELFEQLGRDRVVLDVDPGERHAILGQEVADAERVPREPRTDDTAA